MTQTIKSKRESTEESILDIIGSLFVIALILAGFVAALIWIVP